MKVAAVVFLLFFVGVGAYWFWQNQQFPLPEGETVPLSTESEDNAGNATNSADSDDGIGSEPVAVTESNREIFVTDGSRHSIPLNEILSGGPGKDGIPSIDNPEFLAVSEADFMEDSDIGLGLTLNGESRFYPYRILVWHEIVNDVVGGEPVLVTYCPLCATGIVFERKVNGVAEEFGVSGRLWQSNLLMYNRSANVADESLWSQVLGEAVVGVHTGTKLKIVRSDVVRWGEWKEAHRDTVVLSQNTGASRNYARDPYGDYYTNESVSFGATFNDDRLHPKDLVHGIEIDGQHKAYYDNALEGTVTDTFAGKTIEIVRSESNQLTFTADGEPLPTIPGFWFSWLAVHPDTALFK